MMITLDHSDEAVAHARAIFWNTGVAPRSLVVRHYPDAFQIQGDVHDALPQPLGQVGTVLKGSGPWFFQAVGKHFRVELQNPGGPLIAAMKAPPQTLWRS